MKRKVLIATYYWPPGGGPGVQRYLKFTKYLPAFGIQPVILTVENPTYPIRDSSLEREVPDEVKVYKSKTLEPFRFYAGLSGETAESIKPTVEIEGKTLKTRIGSWIRANVFIPDARVGWLITARRRAEDLIKKHNIELIITTGPPHSVHFIGKYLQEKHRLRWFADFRDPWSQVFYNQLLPRTRLAGQIDQKLEKSVLAQADEVIVVSPSQAENFRLVVERGYRVITNGFDPEDYSSIKPAVTEHEIGSGPENTEKSHATADERKTGAEPDRLLIRHVGNIGEAAVPDTFLKAVYELKQSLNLRVEFIGHVHPRLAQLTEEMGLKGYVRYEEYLPHNKAVERMCGADVLLLCIPDVENIAYHIPGKLFEYLGSGRPILLLGPVDGDSAEIIDRHDAGVVCGFNDLKAIQHALHSFANRKMNTRSDPDYDKGQSVGEKKDHPFSRYALARRLADLINEPSRSDRF